MGQSAAQTVAQYTIIASAVSAVVTGVHGALKRNQNAPAAGFLAASAALNTGITTATFFTLREYVVSPVLTSTLPSRRAQLHDADVGKSEPLTWSDLRTHNLLDSSVSGAATGGLLNSWKAGVRGIVPGVTTGAIACALLQLVFNEVSIARVRYLSRKLPGSQSPSQSHIMNGTEDSRSLSERTLSFLGLRRLSDEEHLEVLKKSRAKYMERIKELEHEEEQRKQ